MSTLPIIFQNPKDLDIFAYKFLVEFILKSLENDVNLCLSLKYTNTQSPTNAYTPALLYCFSVIDLLGSLVAGNARGRKTTNNSRNYMTKYMNYSKENSILLQNMYRHKIVHLAMPKIAIVNEGKLISWKFHDENPNNHLKIDYNDKGDISIFGNGKIHYDGKLILNIQEFKKDIKNSVTSKNGYLESLKITNELRYNFVNAINQIYDPILINE
jgi:hypothetical protein